jgi:plasmid stabilization system protein ParE
MTYDLRFAPEVEEDVIAGRLWYESKAPGLGDEFVRAFYACANEAARNPLLCPDVHGGFRRRLLRRFPYALYFRTEGSAAIVFGLFHCARDPRTIGSRLRGRDSTAR